MEWFPDTSLSTEASLLFILTSELQLLYSLTFLNSCINLFVILTLHLYIKVMLPAHYPNKRFFPHSYLCYVSLPVAPYTATYIVLFKSGAIMGWSDMSGHAFDLLCVLCCSCH